MSTIASSAPPQACGATPPRRCPAAARTACPAGRINTACRTDRSLLAALGAALLLLTAPAYAQTRETDAELKALIPDSAVEDPEAWAKAQPQPDAASPPPPANPPELSPTSPLAEDGSFRLPWPDEQFELPALVSLEPDPDLAETLAAQAEDLPTRRDEADMLRITPQLTLAFPPGLTTFPDRYAFAERFAALSAIERLSGEGEGNPAQLAARARTDGALLARMLRIYGYYDAEVEQTISAIGEGEAAASAKPAVRFDITPGPRYRFGAVALGDLPGTGADYPALRTAFGIQPGDPLDSDRIVASGIALDTALGESGYAFARLGEPSLTIDHSRELGDLDQPVTSGGKYRFAGIASSLEDFLSSEHLEDIARFRRGQLYQRSQVEDLRRAIIATGLVASVAIAPRETRPPQGETPGEVVLDTAIAKAPLRTIAGAVGYDSGEGFRVEASWEHRNLFPPEGLLRLRGVAGTKEQLAGVTLRRNNFHGRDQVLTLDLFANKVARDAYDAKTVALTATFEKVTTLLFQKPWVWSVGLEAVATREREGDVNGVGSPAQNYYIIALPVRGALDTSDNLLDPARGFRAALRASPEFSLDQGRKATYVRIQADASAYLPIGKSAVLAGRVRLGSMPGAAIQDIAPSRRFYAGGGGSVRGFGYQQIGPRNSFAEPSGGRSLSEFSIEARVKTGLFGGALWVVPFIDAGTVEESVTPRFRDMRYGTGLGLRYQTGFGPIRVDVGTPLNRQPGENPVAVYVSLGQAF